MFFFLFIVYFKKKRFYNFLSISLFKFYTDI